MLSVPVVDKNQNPLMPTTPQRAASWIKSGKATPFWKRGIFCVRLNIEPSSRVTQPIAVGVDPGSKMEAYTIKSNHKTFLNIQCEAITHVKSAMDTRRSMRRNRRQRKTPYRKCRLNRSTLRREGRIPPPTKARWNLKLRVIRYLKRLYPLTDIIVEDIKAVTKKGKKKWNKSFSPLEVGKKWFYAECRKLGDLTTLEGTETSELRKQFGLVKNKSDKLKYDFDVHCVDSWVLANSVVGGHSKPDLIKVFCIKLFQWHRRQLHYMNFKKGGSRPTYGSTRSLGFERGSLIKHAKHGLCYVGGTSKERITLHDISTGKRVCQNVKTEDVKVLTYLSWRGYNVSV